MKLIFLPGFPTVGSVKLGRSRSRDEGRGPCSHCRLGSQLITAYNPARRVQNIGMADPAFRVEEPLQPQGTGVTVPCQDRPAVPWFEFQFQAGEPALGIVFIWKR